MTVGVAIVISQLISGCVPQSKFDAPDDTKIAAHVKALLDERPDLGPPNSIQVSSSNHVVYLSGLVSTGLERADAEQIARQAPGVARVVSNVTVEH
jgi:osmotically-inducible protein OsmY